MKKLIIVLLVVMLSLGLSGVAFADTSGSSTQSITAQITGTLTLTVPNTLSGWILLPAAANTTSDTAQTSGGPHTAVVATNCPYTLTVKASAALPTGETDADIKMTTSYDGAPATATSADLTNAFQLKYNTAGGSGDNNTSSSVFSSLANVTITTPEIFVTAANAPDNGTAYIGVEFGQTTAAADAAYYAGSQLDYQIQLTWTASAII